jgi:GDP/UDP-N,N'-diacetylbacillosamine 2-epimerase (hydrolysing)
MRSSQQNLEDFQTVVKAVRNTGLKSILTYPNNDPGSKLLIPYIQNLELPEQINIIPNLGTARLLALFKYFKVLVVGNSSSGLTETAFYCVPALNIGDRQTDRFRASNVFDVPLDEESIRDTLLYCVENYETLKAKFASDCLFFGDGTASVKAKHIISKLLKMSREKILFKKFISNKSPQNESDSSFSTS